MENTKERIQKLKKEKNAVILAHYYVPGEVQEIADYVGDSYFLSEIATKCEEACLVVCGVSFMGESAKLLNPDKKILLPDEKADCPMAHMCTVEQIEKVRESHPDVAVVCYVNSTAELKAHSDVCVTSSNALPIVKNLPNQEIYFIPDQNLGHYVASKVPEKEFIFHDGFCPIHHAITLESLLEAKRKHPSALVLAHPECQEDILEHSDYVGSTSGIIKYAGESHCQEFIIATETGVFYQLEKNNPHKKFYPASEGQICPGMKRITLQSVEAALESEKTQVVLQSETAKKANQALETMLKMAE